LKAPEFLEVFDALGADLGVVAAYGRILPQVLLDRPRLGFINVHASLLPRWRGAAPVHRAITAGDTETGVTIMRVVLALDAGPMLARTRLPIGPDETSVSLESRLSTAGAALLVKTLDALAAGPVTEEPQDEALVTYAHRLERIDSQVDWNRPAQAIHNQIRGLQPWPLAAVVIAGQRVRLLESRLPALPDTAAPRPGVVVEIGQDVLGIGTGDHPIHITRVQPDGRAGMPVRDFLNGRRVAVGDRVDPLPPQ
jgi:methionyl-tRNA formyltransferase